MEVKSVNPAVLRWAVNDAGYDAEALADATKRSSDVVENWLEGTTKPHKGDLDKIAKLLGRNPYFFFRAKPPETVPIVAKFRKSIEDQAVQPVEELKELRHARSVQKVADWAAQESDVHAHLTRRYSSPERTARDFRESLHYTPSDQVGASSKSAVFRDFRQQVENLGIVVLLRNAGSNNFRGFSLPHGRVPLIYINAAYDLATLRTFTLLHEVAHLIRDEEAVCHDNDGEVEAWCNRFAAAVLMPESHLRTYLKSKKFTSLDGNLEAVRLISNRYGASWAAVAIRLKSLGLATQQLIDLVEQTRGEFLEKKSAFSTVRQTVPVKRRAEFGATYPRLLIDAMEHGRLSALDAARYLRADGPQLRELATVLNSGA
ncbi:ImmA/IrrE family metallo-endopeptidase [Arthrobacter sp. ISL-65]|uniref:ImmA/IrrE family metallo-endopeptidase n=1 Tax=Arthrobacter sp. ISL-65 TaxID=2819112 RepID=UPI001BECB6F1|nr:ImmA/IrrE family metallo-endopeptidase [Arthrobacter sp. ISL-65]MBT2550540.1 ImmA/IrrE family metallo-endopeptidase [Arthrobacter sp. ISL-65]